MVAAAAISACKSSTESATGHWHPQVEIGPIAETGKDRVGSFGVRCDYTHTAPDDPILYPGAPEASHSHDFFGAVGVDAFTTLETLEASDSVCDSSGDISAYWTPTLYADGKAIVPVESAAYYRATPGSDLEAITVPPNGLKMISVGAEWTCARVDDPTPQVPECPGSSLTRLMLVFPDCWDGKNLDSSDHRSHLTPSDNGDCPKTHPVHITRMFFEVRYAIPPGAKLRLASGDTTSAHGDAIIHWKPDVIADELRFCVQRSINCDLTWNTTLGY